MAGWNFGAKIRIEHWFDALEETTSTNTLDVLLDTAEKIKNLAYALAPRDTWALASSIAIISERGSTYTESRRRAMILNPENTKFQDAPLDVRGDQVVILPVVGYAGHQEFGTVFHAAQPFLIPASQAVGTRYLPQGFMIHIFGQYKNKPPITREIRIGSL